MFIENLSHLGNLGKNCPNHCDKPITIGNESAPSVSSQAAKLPHDGHALVKE